MPWHRGTGGERCSHTSAFFAFLPVQYGHRAVVRNFNQGIANTETCW